MLRPRRSDRLYRSVLLCVGIALAACAMPQASAAALIGGRAPILTPAQIKALSTPPTAAQVLAKINASSALRQAVSAALKETGGTPKPEAPVLGPPKQPQTAAAAGAGLLPCDYYAGVYLTFATPLAADNLPPTNWAAISMKGLETPDVASEMTSPSLSLSAKVFRDMMTFGEGVFVEGVNPPVTVTVQFSTSKPGLYALTFMKGSTHFNVSARIVSSGGASAPLQPVGAVPWDAGLVLFRLTSDQVGYPRYCEVTYTGTYPGFGLEIWGVQVMHMFFKGQLGS
jgi:hypothetical protein